jgi:hypothetical protein
MECRICFGTDHPETMHSPCRCSGTSAYIHDSCLRTYLSYYPDRRCRVCHGSMEHPLVDLERNLLCAAILLAWAGILLSVSAVSPFTKLVCLIGLLCVLVHHVRRKQLSYTITIGAIAATAFLYMSDPLYLPQTLCLIGVLLVLATLFLFVPIETMFLVLVVGLAFAYTLLLTLAVAIRSDPAFTSLFLLVMSTLWLVIVRPARPNEV